MWLNHFTTWETRAAGVLRGASMQHYEIVISVSAAFVTFTNVTYRGHNKKPENISSLDRKGMGDFWWIPSAAMTFVIEINIQFIMHF